MGITESEIQGQPTLWRSIVDGVIQQRQSLADFLSQALFEESEIILTGAGSSAFVGEIAASILQSQLKHRCRAVPTTDLVTHAQHWIDRRRPLLMISFARSGNSPESIAAVQRVQQLHPSAFHLVITCNRDGALAKLSAQACTSANSRNAGDSRFFCFVLPEAANDLGLAMIGSVTGMLLVSLSLPRLSSLSAFQSETLRLSQVSSQTLQTFEQKLREISRRPFTRAICLGSGPLFGVAREAHLKIQELSDGQVTGHFDSYLGFRHGPKALINDSSLVIFFLSSEPAIMPYEKDLVQAIHREQPEAWTLAISEKSLAVDVDDAIFFGEQLGPFAPLAMLLPAQLLANYKSENLGLNPDSPSARGAIHRVVQGVTIYPFESQPEI